MKDIAVEIERVVDECIHKKADYDDAVPQGEFMNVLRMYSLMQETLEHAGYEVEDVWRDLKMDVNDIEGAKDKTLLLRGRFKMIASQALSALSRCDDLMEVLKNE